MPQAAPAYYSSLAPFRDLFAAGTPILMYHKVGPRPAGVRIKGLYVSAALFDRQLAELRAAGYASAPLDVISTGADANLRGLAVTFDDGFRNVWQHALGPLEKHGFRAINYLVADLIGKTNEWDLPVGEASEPLMNDAQVREWLAAGHEIGSHTLTHPWLTRLAPAEAREEISASKKKLEDRFGVGIDHFCYPYGDWNPTVRDLVVGAGYRTACTTAPGVNTPGTSPFELKRFMARYPTRNWKTFKAWLSARLGG